MKKIITLIGLVALLLASTSAINTKPEVARVGYQAPNFTIHTATDVEYTLQQHRGRAIILTMWSSADPESRIANIRDEHEAKRRGIAHVSINFDRNSAIAGSIAKIDKVKMIYCPENDREQMAQRWGINAEEATGMSSWLIGADGTIRQRLN